MRDLLRVVGEAAARPYVLVAQARRALEGEMTLHQPVACKDGRYHAYTCRHCKRTLRRYEIGKVERYLGRDLIGGYLRVADAFDAMVGPCGG